MLITPIKTRRFILRESLFDFILEHVPRVTDGAVLVVTSKIVALAEGRWVAAAQGGAAAVAKQRRALVAAESEWGMKTRYTYLTVRQGAIVASAGIDESNASGGFILLPRDSYAAAATLWRALRNHFKIKKCGVIITDSRMMPLRAGVVAIALGYAGFKGVREYRGTPDLDGRTLKFSRTDVADSLATAAVVCMGEGRESQPLALITDAPVEWVARVPPAAAARELYIDPREDVYAPLWRTVRRWGRHIGTRVRYKKRK